MKIKAIIFDIDGTVYPNNWMHIRSIPLFLRYGRRLMRFSKARKYLHYHPDEAQRVGLSFRDFQGQLLSQLSHGRYDTERCIAQMEQFRSHWELLFKQIKPYRFFVDSVMELKQEGFKLGLFSDFPIYPKLTYLNLDGLWDAVLCSEDSGALKPDSRGFLQISQMLGVQPHEVLFVGNSYAYDVLGAKGAGMYAAHLKYGKAKLDSRADLTFYGYQNFPQLVKNWIASL